MDVFISADIEGITGLVSWSQCAGPDEEAADWAFAREMMTHDVNAAIRGARKAGARRVVVKDSHGDGRNLLAAELEPGIELISGTGCRWHDVMMQGVDSSFGAAFLVGYHAKAGTGRAVMDHTISGKVHRLWLNGAEIGEIGLSAGTAGRHGVPVVLVCSDVAGCEEAAGLIPGVRTAPVKEGLGKFMGKCLHPEHTAGLIEKAAEDGVRHAAEVQPWRPPTPLKMRMELKGEDQADYAERLVGVKRVDGYTVEWECESFEDAHRSFISMIILAGAASDD
jgi:D-amino peptidase